MGQQAIRALAPAATHLPLVPLVHIPSPRCAAVSSYDKSGDNIRTYVGLL